MAVCCFGLWFIGCFSCQNEYLQCELLKISWMLEIFYSELNKNAKIANPMLCISATDDFLDFRVTIFGRWIWCFQYKFSLIWCTAWSDAKYSKKNKRWIPLGKQSTRGGDMIGMHLHCGLTELNSKMMLRNVCNHFNGMERTLKYEWYMAEWFEKWLICELRVSSFQFSRSQWTAHELWWNYVEKNGQLFINKC